jgi:hypothetical protein
MSEISELILMKIDIMDNHQKVSGEFSFTDVTCPLLYISFPMSTSLYKWLVHGVDVVIFKKYNFCFKHF